LQEKVATGGVLSGFVHLGTLEEGSRASTKARMRRILVSSASVLSFSSSMVVTCLELESKGDFCDGSGLKTLSILLNLCLKFFSPTRICVWCSHSQEHEGRKRFLGFSPY